MDAPLAGLPNTDSGDLKRKHVLALTPWNRLKRSLGLATEPEKIARAAFESVHPDKRVVWSQLAADESERFVVGVCWDWGGIPPRCEFFEVAKATGRASPLLDDQDYRPRNWR